MRRVMRTAAVVAAAALALVSGAVGYVWTGLPTIEGDVVAPGLQAPAALLRDAYGIPHIEAESEDDAYFALGYAHAQDRLWQMEFQRRLVAGRLAEAVGAAGLPYDRLTRVLGLYRVAAASRDRLAPGALATIRAYARGVNAYLATRRGALPPEFLLLRLTPEPWRVEDSLAITRLMALDLAENWRGEMRRARLARRLSPAQMADLFPGDGPGVPTTLAALPDDEHLDRLAAVLPPEPPSGLGSNAWALAGARTRSGKPLLANDPHLRLGAPGVWYLAHLRTQDGLNAIGATLAGLPAVVLGRNDRIAWGLTNTGGDVQDLFVERLDPTDPGRYLTPDGPRRFAVREERIAVKGGETVTLRVRTTRHGPVLSDAEPGGAGGPTVLALAWTALDPDDRTPEAGLRLARARDWPGFVDALRAYASPQQNVHYADVDGRIGFYAPGRLPVRASGDGLLPAEGWTGAKDWTGFVPFEGLPHAVDPPDGRLFNANNRVVGPSFPYLIAREWGPPERARRLDAALSGRGYDLGAMRRLQRDEVSTLAREVLPSMLARLAEAGPLPPLARELRDWDRVADRGRRQPLVFAAWRNALERRLYGDELGPLFDSLSGPRSAFLITALTTRAVWCDDVTTSGRRETCPEVAASAWHEARGFLDARHGADPAAWRWGGAQAARLENRVLGAVPLLGRLADLAFAKGGDDSSVDVAHPSGDPDEPFAVTAAAGYRGVYDLARPEASRFVAVFGQSGHPFSRHYRDMTTLWAAGGDLPMTADPAAYRPAAGGALRLLPEATDARQPEG